MSELRSVIAEIRAEHTPEESWPDEPPYCQMCVPARYPCDAARLADAVEEHLAEKNNDSPAGQAAEEGTNR